MKFIQSYFLEGYKSDSAFEREKAKFLYYFILCALTVTTIVFVSQMVLELGGFYRLSGAIALTGIGASLFLFRAKKIDAAGHTMVFSVLFLVILQNVFRDIYSTDPGIRYRIYLNVASLIGVYFLIISFFRSARVIFFYAVVFEIILFTHSLVIYFNLRSLPGMSTFVWQHFATVFIAIVALAFISTWLLEYMNIIIRQNIDYAQRIAKQKEELEITVTEKTRDLRASNEKLREFAYIASHDLKEPLRTISGFITLVKKELCNLKVSSPDLLDYVNHVTSGTRQMEQLINDILSYSKLNTVERPYQPVNMKQVIDESKLHLAQAIRENQAVIVADRLPTVIGDYRLLTQLFQNILSNAIKYCRENQTPRIEIRCQEDGKQVLFAIKDNGIGISKEYYSTIFQAFTRLHSRKDYEGTGIGLAICKKIIDIHRGEIWIESTEDVGTTFFFTLPKSQALSPAKYPVVHAA